MTLTANAIINIYNTYDILSEKELDLNTACVIASNLNKLTVPKDIIEKKREDIIMKYAEKDSDGNITQLENNNIKITDMTLFGEDMNYLLSETTDIEVQTISKNTLSDIKVSPRDIFPLIQNNLLTE